MVRYPEFGIPIPTEYEIHGIDVSRYQQNIAWDAVKEMEVGPVKLGFAFIKATEGVNNVDPYFKRNWRQARKAGMVRGAYHFFIASKDGKTQAANFIDRVELVSGDLPPVLDVEHSLAADAPRIHPELSDNILFYRRFGEGEVDRAFAAAELVFDQTFTFPRQTAIPLETRGVIAALVVSLSCCDG